MAFGGQLDSVADLVDRIEHYVSSDDDSHLDDQAGIWITSPPGNGKTSLTGQVAKRNDWGIEFAQFEENMDLTGVPDVSGERTKYMKPEFYFNLEELAKKHERVILFVDEAAKIEPGAHKNFYSLLEERQVAPHEPLPSNVRIVLASNTVEHGALSDQDIPPAVVNRVGMFNYSGPTTQEWVSYANSVKVHPVVTSFISENGSKLTDFDASRPGPQATPRSWSNLGRSISKKEKRMNEAGLNLSANWLENEASAYLPQSLAKELTAHFSFEQQIPKLADIVSDPQSAMLPDNISANYYLAFRMAHAMDEDNVSEFREYVERMDNVEVKKTFSKAVDKMGKSDLLKAALKGLSKDAKNSAQKDAMDSVLKSTSRSARR